MTTLLLLLALTACGIAFYFYRRWVETLEWLSESQRMYSLLQDRVKAHNLRAVISRSLTIDREVDRRN